MACSILHGKHLKISGNQFPPYVYSTVKNGIEVFEGTNYEIIHSASVKYNFTYELDAPKGKATGSKLKNGTWTGLFGDVFYGKSDLAIVLAHTRDRNGLIDFTTSFGSADLIFSTAHPKAALKPEAIVYSFQPEVWFLILITILAILPVVYFSIRQYHPAKLSFLRSCEIICKICLEQSNNSLPHGLEFLAGMYLLCIIILGTGYKCNLLTAISFPQPDKIPTNFLELAEQSPEYKVYFDMTGIVGYNYFMKGQTPIIANLRDRFKNNLVRNNPAKCVLASFIEPASVCIAWHTVLNQVVGKNLTMDYGLSPIFRTQLPVTRTWVTIGLQKNSIYTNAFSYISSSYYETGMITKWHSDIVKKFEISGKQWMQDEQNDNETKPYKKALLEIRNSKTKGAKPLHFKNVSVIFKVITFGLSVAAGLFCGEISYYHLPIILRSSPEIVQNLKREKPWLIYMQILWGQTETEDEYKGMSMHHHTGTIDFDVEIHQAQLAKQERIINEYPSPVYADYSVKESSVNDSLVFN